LLPALYVGMTALVNLGLELGIIAGLSVLNGLFSGAEIALLSVRKTRLEELSDESRAARSALNLRRNPERLLATVQVGITVVGATAGAFGGAAMSEPLAQALIAAGAGEWAEEAALALVVALVSFSTIVLGELVPKSLALRSTERVALTLAPAVDLLAWLVRPVVWFLTTTSNLVLRPFNDKTTFTESRMSRDELQQLVEEASTVGTLHQDAGDIASRAMDLGGLRVAAVMVPRTSIIGLERGASREEILQVLREHPHARYPLLGASPDEIVGYVIARELYAVLLVAGPIDLQALARSAPFLPETVPAIDALRQLQHARTPLGMVVDEAGGIAGVVTIEDITEELVGEILGEHEKPFASVHPEAGGARIAGNTAIHELNRSLGLELPEGPTYTTLAGLVVDLAQHIPAPGEVVEIAEGVSAEVLDSTPRQVRWLRLRFSEEPPPGHDE
jgi:putative hemolysin